MPDPIPSWNVGETKRQIVAGVRAMADETSDAFVPTESRIVALDNDGTLWSEKPGYILDQIVEKLDVALTSGR